MGNSGLDEELLMSVLLVGFEAELDIDGAAPQAARATLTAKIAPVAKARRHRGRRFGSRHVSLPDSVMLRPPAGKGTRA